MKGRKVSVPKMKSKLSKNSTGQPSQTNFVPVPNQQSKDKLMFQPNNSMMSALRQENDMQSTYQTIGNNKLMNADPTDFMKKTTDVSRQKEKEEFSAKFI